MASISFVPRFKLKDLSKMAKPRIIHASGVKKPTMSQQEAGKK